MDKKQRVGSNLARFLLNDTTGRNAEAEAAVKCLKSQWKRQKIGLQCVSSAFRTELLVVLTSLWLLELADESHIHHLLQNWHLKELRFKERLEERANEKALLLCNFNIGNPPQPWTPHLLGLTPGIGLDCRVNTASVATVCEQSRFTFKYLKASEVGCWQEAFLNYLLVPQGVHFIDSTGCSIWNWIMETQTQPRPPSEEPAKL